jgi:membrane-bound lytic murein transglycosylase D
VDEILALNPGYKRPVLPTNGSMSLVIPADKVEAFLVNLSRHDPASASWRTYELRDGEGLESAADRLGISATRLRQVNGLSPRARIGSGYTLIVPSESEGDRITLANLLPTKPQAGAVEPLPPHADPAHGGPGQEWPPDGGGTQGDGAGQCPARDKAEKADKGKPGKRAVEEREKPSAKGNAKAAAATKAGRPEKADKPVRQEKAEKPAKSVSKAAALPAKAKAEPPKRR